MLSQDIHSLLDVMLQLVSILSYRFVPWLQGSIQMWPHCRLKVVYCYCLRMWIFGQTPWTDADQTFRMQSVQNCMCCVQHQCNPFTQEQLLDFSADDVTFRYRRCMCQERISDPGWSFILWASAAGEDGAVFLWTVQITSYTIWQNAPVCLTTTDQSRWLYSCLKKNTGHF